jgi:hypothetical protein
MEIPTSLDDVFEMALRYNATSVSLEYVSGEGRRRMRVALVTELTSRGNHQ